MTKKRAFLQLFLTMLLLMTFHVATAQNVAEFSRQGTGKLSLLKSEIDSITFECQSAGERFDQLIWTRDSVYRTSLTNDDDVTFSEVALPSIYRLTEGIGNWSELWLMPDGSFVVYKYREGTNDVLEQAAILAADDNTGTVNYAFADFQTDGSLKRMMINGNLFTVRRMYDGMMDVAINLGDTLTLYADSIMVSDITAGARAGTRNTGTTGNVLIAAFEIVTGFVFKSTGKACIVASYYRTPMSAALLLTGAEFYETRGIALKDAFKRIKDEFDKIKESFQFLGKKSALQKAIENMKVIDPELLGDEESLMPYFLSKEMEKADKLTKKNISEEEVIERLRGSVYTYKPRDIRSESATLKGYFAGSKYYDSNSDGTFGFALYEAANNMNSRLITANDYHTLELNATGLKKATKYEYRAFFRDHIHNVTAFGEPVQFTTPEAVTGEAVLKHDQTVDLYGSVVGVENDNTHVWVVYSTENTNPQLNGAKSSGLEVDMTQDGDFKVNFKDYDDKKIYYYRTVIQANGMPTYGEVRSFGLNDFRSSTYKLMEQVGMSTLSETGNFKRAFYARYEVRIQFRPTSMQSDPSLLLMKDGEVLAKYDLTFEKAGNTVDTYVAEVEVGFEPKDLVINNQTYTACCTGLTLAPCFNALVEGEKRLIGFPDDIFEFQVFYNKQPDIKFTDARMLAPENYTDNDGLQSTLCSYSFNININGAFWMSHAFYKLKSSGEWDKTELGNLTTLVDMDLNDTNGYFDIHGSNYLKNDLDMMSYFNIILPSGKSLKSSNHLKFSNNGYIINGVKVENGVVSARFESPLAETEESAATGSRGESPKNGLFIGNCDNVVDKITAAQGSAWWRNVPTISELKKQVTTAEK